MMLGIKVLKMDGLDHLIHIVMCHDIILHKNLMEFMKVVLNKD